MNLSHTQKGFLSKFLTITPITFIGSSPGVEVERGEGEHIIRLNSSAIQAAKDPTVKLY